MRKLSIDLFLKTKAVKLAYFNYKNNMINMVHVFELLPQITGNFKDFNIYYFKY